MIRFFILTIITIILFNNLKPERKLLDGICCIKIGDGGCIPVYYSDQWFLSPLGIPITLEDRIIRVSWLSYGNDHGIKMINNGSSAEYAQQYLEMLQEQKGVSLMELEKMAAMGGYTLNDIRRELNEQYIFQQTIETTFAATGALNVTAEMVQEYYDNNPQIIPAEYKIQTGNLNKTLSEYENENYDFEDIIWEKESYLIKENELSNNFKDIKKYKINDIVFVMENKDKSELIIYKLIEKKDEIKIKLSDCYEEILGKIQQKKYAEEYLIKTESLISDDTLLYFDKDLKEKCKSFLNKKLN